MDSSEQIKQLQAKQKETSLDILRLINKVQELEQNIINVDGKYKIRFNSLINGERDIYDKFQNSRRK